MTPLPGFGRIARHRLHLPAEGHARQRSTLRQVRDVTSRAPRRSRTRVARDRASARWRVTVDRGVVGHHFPRRRAPPEVAPAEALLDAFAAKGTTRACCARRLAMPCPGSGRTLGLDLDLALGPPTSSAGVAPEDANPSAVGLGASTSDGCLAPRRNSVSPSRANEVKDGRSPPPAARAKRRVLDVVEHDGSPRAGAARLRDPGPEPIAALAADLASRSARMVASLT